MKNEDIKKEVDNYTSLKWNQSHRGKAVIFLVVVFLLTSWLRLFLAILILPVIYLVKKGSKSGIILAGIYSGILTIINSILYLGYYNTQIGSYLGIKPIILYVVIYVFVLINLIKAYKVESLKGKLDLDKVIK